MIRSLRSNRRFHRWATIATTLSSTSLLLVGAAPAEATAPATAKTAAGWLTQQLVAGSHFEATFGSDTYPDQGLTIDAILAFAASRTADTAGAAATTWLTQPDILAGYVGDGTTESYSGAHGKAALALQIRGQNPRAVVGRDLIAELQELQTASGRFADRSAFGDFSNAYGQSLAVIALRRANVPSAKASGYLAAAACPGGGIPLQFGQATCTPDIDTTAIAAQAFQATGRTTALNRAASWLASQQSVTGGYGANTNANSTGLAAAALALAGRTAAADRAIAALRTLQQGCAAPTEQRGAIAADTTGFVLASATRATPQAMLGLAKARLGSLVSAGSNPTAPVLSCSAAPVAAAPVALAAAGAVCPTSAGVSVIVDLKPFGLGVKRGCATGDPASGLAALTGAGFAFTFVPGQPGFICQIKAKPNPCNGAPSTAYWSYWHAPRGGAWSYSTLGAGSYNPAPNTTEGWAFGAGVKPSVAAP